MPLSSLRGANIPTTVERIAPSDTPARRMAIAPRRVGSHLCYWPIGEPATPAFRFCYDLALLDVPYCDEHARRAYKLVANATRRMKCCLRNFNEHGAAFDPRGAAAARAAARVRRVTTRGGPAGPALPLPRPPGSGRNGSSGRTQYITPYSLAWITRSRPDPHIDGRDVEVVNKTGQIDSTSLTYNQ